MLSKYLSGCLIAGVFALFPAVAQSQWVVHAVEGNVKSINSATETMNIEVEDGFSGQFAILTKPNVQLAFDKVLRADSTPATEFHTVGAHVIVYYFGFGDHRTVVALKDLGAGPFEKIVGTVVSFDKHDHLLTVRKNAGGNAAFALNEKVVMDTGSEVTAGLQFSPSEGNEVRVTAAPLNGEQVALFIHLRR